MPSDAVLIVYGFSVFIVLELMKAKAEELGIDLKERYDYGSDEEAIHD